MPNPRQVLPGQFYLLTRRTTQRQFLLRPDSVTNNAFIYCLAEAAQRFGIVILLTVAESNHHHTVVYDPNGTMPEFIEHFHKMLARCLNARWGHWENLWSSVEPSVTRLLNRAAVIDKLIYSASNPVKDLLVEKATQWPGTNGYRALLGSRELHATRPPHFFRKTGTMPEEVTLTLEIPAELGLVEQVIDEVRTGVEEVERAMMEFRRKTGARILGRRRVLEQSWRASPDSAEPRRNLRPRFAGSADVRIPALREYREFLASYRVARSEWLAGKQTVFPPGTYKLRIHAPIVVAPLPTT